MHLIHLILIIFTLFSGCKKNSSYQTHSIPNILQTMPDQDRKILDSFFQLLFRDYNFAYTLFGNKPMSMACFSSQTSSWTLYHPSESLTLEKGWERWNTYALFFPSNEFVLKQYKDERGIFDIFLISKRHVLQVISDNLDTFQEILDSHISPQQLLEQLCHSQQDIMEILNGNSALLGMLLGYGKINSANFERKVNICHDFNAKMTPPFSAYDEMKSLEPISRNLVRLYNTGTFSPPSQDGFLVPTGTSLADELNDILLHEDRFELYGSDFFLDKIIVPVFMARREDLETERLHEDYLATKEQLHQAYLKGSFLEVTLNQWIHPQ